MDIVHGNTDGRKSPLATDAEPLLAGSGHAMFGEEGVHVGLQAAFSGEGGHELQAKIVGHAHVPGSMVRVPAPPHLDLARDPAVLHQVERA